MCVTDAGAIHAHITTAPVSVSPSIGGSWSPADSCQAVRCKEAGDTDHIIVQEMQNQENVSIILYTIIQSVSLARVFKGDAANKRRLAEFREFQRL